MRNRNVISKLKTIKNIPIKPLRFLFHKKISQHKKENDKNKSKMAVKYR
jgi:hypothetical protein